MKWPFKFPKWAEATQSNCLWFHKVNIYLIITYNTHSQLADSGLPSDTLLSHHLSCLFFFSHRHFETLTWGGKEFCINYLLNWAQSVTSNCGYWNNTADMVMYTHSHYLWSVNTGVLASMGSPHPVGQCLFFLALSAAVKSTLCPLVGLATTPFLSTLRSSALCGHSNLRPRLPL